MLAISGPLRANSKLPRVSVSGRRGLRTMVFPHAKEILPKLMRDLESEPPGLAVERPFDLKDQSPSVSINRLDHLILPKASSPAGDCADRRLAPP